MGRFSVILEGLSYYKRHRKYLLAVTAAYYGLIFLTALLIVGIEGGVDLQVAIREAAVGGVLEAFPGLLEAYLRNPLLAIVYTFFVNLALGTLAYITIPGLLVFFFAPALVLFRAIMWGVVFAPTTPVLAMAVVLSLPTLILEGLGYVLAVVPSTYLGLSWLSPKRVFREEKLSRKEAFKKELVNSAKAYAWVALVLVVAAVVEVVSVQLSLTIS